MSLEVGIFGLPNVSNSTLLCGELTVCHHQLSDLIAYHGPMRPQPSTENDQVRLILLPGLDGHGISFHRFIGLLPSHIKASVIPYPPDRAMNYEELVGFVTDQLPATPFFLLGESFSSPIAIAIAAARPRDLKGLIITSGFARNPLWGRPNFLARFMHPFFFRVYGPYVRLKTWRRADKDLTEVRLKAVSKLRPEVMASRVRNLLRVNVLRELAGLEVPVLHLRGERDRLVNGRNSREMLACLPTMRLVELDGGHCVLRSRAPLAVEVIANFINEHVGSDAAQACGSGVAASVVNP
jgi:pimeloyl-ACP methyl ester carboxylesterase